MTRDRLYLFDTTLRDGAQTTGVDFSLEDKRAVAQRRVEEIEALAGHGLDGTSKSFGAGSRGLFQSGRGGPN